MATSIKVYWALTVLFDDDGPIQHVSCAASSSVDPLLEIIKTTLNSGLTANKRLFLTKNAEIDGLDLLLRLLISRPLGG